MVLLVGASGCGKTLLLRRLNYGTLVSSSFNNLEEPPTTISTVGTNLMRVLVNKKQEVEVRELGGCMAPIWKNYFNTCDSLMFVIDTSDKTKLSCSLGLLIEILTHPKLKTIPILLILNKIDSPHKLSYSQLNDYIHLDGIVHHCTQRIEILQTSAKNGTGLERVVDWMKHYCS